MNTFFRRFILALSAVLVSAGAFAQKITLQLQDATTGGPVAYATVSLTVPGKTGAYKYVLSDDKGAATFEGVKKGEYELKAELLGYKVYKKTVTCDGKTTLNLGVIKLDVDRETLDAARVTDVGNPIIIKKDTIEYNASSFKTTDNDVLEDLLKKLPGVEIGDDGSITVNGKTVDKITIDGKTFFQNDPQLASKNLPAKMIKKVKVVRKKSEQAEFTGIDDGEEQTVLDLSVQDNAMNGMVGNLTAGLGHDVPESGVYDGTDHKWTNEGWRFTDNLFLGRFSTGRQYALIGNANNANSQGFGNFSGNAMNSMRGGGGGGNGGITTSWMIGGNAAWDLFDDKMNLGGNYVYNGSQNELERDSYTINYLADGSGISNRSSNLSNNNSYGHRFGIRMEHKFSDNTSILFEPQINFGTGNFLQSTEQSRYNLMDDVETLSSEGFTSNAGNNRNLATSGRFLLRQKLGIPGRTLTFNANYNFSNNTIDGLNQSLTTSYADGVQKDSIINQRYDQNQRNSSLGGTLTYTEPLGGNFYVEANYSLTWNRSSSYKNTFNSLAVDGFGQDNHPYLPADPEVADPAYSNRIVNRYINQNIGANMLYQSPKLRAQVGLGLMPTNTYNSTTRRGEEQTYDNKVVNFAPRAMIRYNHSDYTNLFVRYNGRSSQPSVSQLMPVPDNSNPLSVSFGNPYLKPYFSHNVWGEYRHSNLNTFSSLTVNFNGSMVTSPIVNATWYNGQTSAQYSYPVNGPASFNTGLRANYNTPIAKSDFSINNNTYVSYSRSSSFVEKNKGSIDMDLYTTDGDTGTFDYEKFHGDYADLGASDKFLTNRLQSLNFSESLRLTYRNDYVEVIVGGRTSGRKSWYTVANAQSPMTWSNRATFSANWTPLGGWMFQSDYSYVWYNGYTTPQKPEHRLNAQVAKTLGTFTVALRAFDILNQAKTLSISESGNSYSESRTNTLGRYIILSVSYRFGSFGGRRMGSNMGSGLMGSDRF